MKNILAALNKVMAGKIVSAVLSDERYEHAEKAIARPFPIKEVKSLITGNCYKDDSWVAITVVLDNGSQAVLVLEEKMPILK